MSETTAPEVSEVEREREEYRRRQELRAHLTSVASAMKESFFSPEYFVQAWPKVVDGLLLNLKVLLAALPLTALFGTLLALIRLTKSPVMFPLRVAARLYTTIMRGIPMLVVLYLIGFGIPGLGLFGRIDKAVLGTIAVVMSYSAYIAEVLRAGFEDVHPSQRASARSLGLTSSQTTWLVIIPQALRKMAAQIVVAKTYNFTPYVVASVLFIMLSVPFILINDRYTANLRRREQTGGMV